MKGDFTRFTHDSAKRYTRVLEQQGRVTLDADHNEWAEIVTHLARTEAIDVIGRCGVPEHGGGFEIGLNAGGSGLTISRGRIWVDGILCSNEEADESPPVALGAQTDLPGYKPPEAEGVYVVYLDVWERHVTAIEDPDLREVALGGPDTTTRTRTVCQVKLAPYDGAAGRPLRDLECRPFTALPATGLLAAQSEPGEDPTNPCALPAEAGYRGLENRLYRVEIHDAGRDETGKQVRIPTFKWSRDNGSVVFPVTEVETAEDGKSTVTVGALGRDEVLTVRPDDWVEVLGDETELHGEHGTLARIEPGGIDRADREIELSEDVSALEAEGHLKLRRWDHHATDDVALVDGALPIQRGWFELEDGVQIQFDPDGATYHVGDYWLIPARTRQGSVLWPREGTPPEPVALPRLGIEHHYCTLALARLSEGSWTLVRDCRPSFLPLTEIEGGCCTVVVHPGKSIQEAIDSLPRDRGGCVCLKAGEHPIDAPVVIDRSDVHLHGESSGAWIVRDGGVPLLDIRGQPDEVSRITVEGVGLRGGGSGGRSSHLVTIRNARDVRLRDCTLELKAGGELDSAVDVTGAEDVEISGCRFRGLPAAVEAIGSSRLAILDNRIEAEAGLTAIAIRRSGDGHRIVGNVIDGYLVGVQLGGEGETIGGGRDSLIAGNRIACVQPESEGDLYGIDVAAADCAVRGNHVDLPPHTGGIRITGPGARVEDNQIAGTAEAGGLALGIFVGFRPETSSAPPDRALILRNRLSGRQHGILAAGRKGFPIEGVRAVGNHIEGDGDTQAIGIGLDHSFDGLVADNRIGNTGSCVTVHDGRGNVIRGNRALDGALGIFAERERDLVVAGNVVERMSRLGFGGLRLEGTATIRQCRFVNTSYWGFEDRWAIGVGVLNDFADRLELAIEDCEILDTGVWRDTAKLHQPSVGIWGLFVESWRIAGNLVALEVEDVWMDPAQGDRALFLIGRLQVRYITKVKPGLGLGLSLGAASAQITGNKFVGPGSPNLIEVGIAFQPTQNHDYLIGWTFERTIFAHNDVLHKLPISAVQRSGSPPPPPEDEKDQATIHFGLFDGVIQGNQVKSAFYADEFYLSFAYPSMNFREVGNVTLLGNVTTGPVIRQPRVTPSNHGDFNIVLL